MIQRLPPARASDPACCAGGMRTQRHSASPDHAPDSSAMRATDRIPSAPHPTGPRVRRETLGNLGILPNPDPPHQQLAPQLFSSSSSAGRDRVHEDKAQCMST